MYEGGVYRDGCVYGEARARGKQREIEIVARERSICEIDGEKEKRTAAGMCV